MKCPKCGHNVTVDRNSCLYCGASIKNKITPDTAEVPNKEKTNIFFTEDGKK